MPDMATNGEQRKNTLSQDSRFLITGAKGCIGSWVVKNLIERGSRPVIFDSDPQLHRLNALLSDEQLARIITVSGDITDPDYVDRAVAEHGITHVIQIGRAHV